MYEISRETYDLRPGDGVDQVCQLLIQLSEDPRPMERITIFSDRVEVQRYVDPGEEMVMEGPPTSIDSMLRSVRMVEMSPSNDSGDALRLAYVMTRKIGEMGCHPICWVTGDAEALAEGLKHWGNVLIAGTPGTLFGLQIHVTGELGGDRLVLVGGASRHHNPQRATVAVSSVMQWVEE